MEPPTHPADSADPAARDDPSTSAEESAKQPGKWALVRNLNQVLKTFAVMPALTPSIVKIVTTEAQRN